MPQCLALCGTNFALMIGVSELMIGLTIVAAGTSMPEVATSIIARIRGERDIAVGNLLRRPPPWFACPSLSAIGVTVSVVNWVRD